MVMAIVGGVLEARAQAMHNWRRIDHRVTTSGQPTHGELAALADLGVSHVVNLGLHTHRHALADEAAAVRELGMTYVHIPVGFSAPGEEDFARFCAVMADLKDARVHVHCIANFRASAFLYRYRRDVECLGESAARADLDAVWEPDLVWRAFIDRRS